MGLAALDAALSGLRISQQQISVVSNNVANVGTPGYSRKILPQTSQSIEGVTVGVRAGTIMRNVNLNLARDMWTQVSSVGYLDVQQTYLSRIQQFHGDPSKNMSVAAELSQLMDTFSALADSPEDTFLQANVVNQASTFSNKVNDLAKLITSQRNDVQDEMQSTVNRINDILSQIASLNDQVEANTNLGRTTALLEDKRDDAIKELASLMDISFFQRGDGVLVVQTSEGVELASDKVTPLYFSPRPLGPAVYYPSPGTAAAVYVGNPSAGVGAVDITDRAAGVGGRLGGLIDLRDNIFPKQMAQIDELAHKVALRFEAQGLLMFTDASGSVPLDTAPDPTTVPDPTPVPYIGFASIMRVNAAVLADNSLVQSGTYGAANIQAGDNEVIRRIIENAFGAVNYQEASNTDTATQVDLLNTGGDDLQTWLGLSSTNTLAGGRNLAAYVDVNALITAANGALAPTSDTFSITFSETRNGLGSYTIDISMAAAQLQAGATAADQIVAEINSQITLAGVPAGLAASASVNANGQIVLTTAGSLEIDATSPANPMSQAGLNYLGFSENVGNPIAPTDPYFDIAVGNNALARITLEPGDDVTDLATKLQAVDGLAIDLTNLLAGDGYLRLRPGNDYDNPDYGGDLRIIAGPFTIAGASYGSPPAVSARTALASGGNIVSALFGTYSGSGASAANTSPIVDYGYQSVEDGSAMTPSYLAFRETLLGPGANIETQIIGASTIADYAQKMVNEQSQQIVLVQGRLEDEQALQTVLETQFMDDSAVNLDEELGHLITVQTAYSASARVVTAVNELFQELLNAIR